MLWRLDDTGSGYVQYIQSRTAPDCTALPEGMLTAPPATRPLQPVLDAATAGRKLSFRLAANPVRLDRDTRRRVGLRTEKKQIAWLVRKGGQHGFAIPAMASGQPELAVSRPRKLTGCKPPDGSLTIEQVRFDGHLVITDAARFTDAIRTGIGRARAYGCGLLTVAPPRGH